MRGDKPKARKPRVVWADDTVDNEGMGKKKSKSEFGEQSSLRESSMLLVASNFVE